MPHYGLLIKSSSCLLESLISPFSNEVVDARFFFGIDRHLIHIHSDIYITPRPANPSSSPFENLNHICKLAAAASSSSCVDIIA